MTSWGLILADYGRRHLPVHPLQAIWEALGNTVQYLVAHPETYFWSKTNMPWLQLVGETLLHSTGLLVLSMTVAVTLGFALGMTAARLRPRARLIGDRTAFCGRRVDTQFPVCHDPVGRKHLGA